MRITRYLLIAALALGLLSLVPSAVQEARADGGFHVGIGTGFHFGHGHYRHYGRYGPYYGRHPWYRHHPRYSVWGYGYRPWYPRPPRTVYVLPPQPAPQLQVQPAPGASAVQPSPSMAYDTSYCREYSRTAMVDGAPTEIYGTACRQPDGSWRIMN